MRGITEAPLPFDELPLETVQPSPAWLNLFSPFLPKRCVMLDGHGLLEAVSTSYASLGTSQSVWTAWKGTRPGID